MEVTYREDEQRALQVKAGGFLKSAKVFLMQKT